MMLGLFGRPARALAQFDMVKAGAKFRRVHPDQLVETARVLSVAPGPNGIPHVHYAVTFARARCPCFEDGPRVMALPSFAQVYRDPVEAGAA